MKGKWIYTCPQTQSLSVPKSTRPPEMPIWPHNEYGWSTVNPAWITFSALVSPETGGQTPINSSVALAAKIRDQAPLFYNDMKNKGIRYIYRYT